MAVCNLFNSLNNPHGSFLMFSQYTEDLTKNHAHGYTYRIIPSGFITADFVYNSYNNNTISEFFQNNFENGCAFGRNIYGDSWTPDHSKYLFWNTLSDSGLVGTLNYRGVINHQSYDKISNMGYSNIHCYIPDYAKNEIITIKLSENQHTSNIHKWNESNLIGRNESANNKEYTYNYNESWLEYGEEQPHDFNINAIIVLYDIEYVNSDGEVLNQYKDIPMGIYFPGLIENGEMTNQIRKLQSNKDIYGAGTSYNVRICTRMVPSQDNIQIYESSSNDSNLVPLNQLLSLMSENMNKMREITDTKLQNLNVIDTEAFKSTLDILNNSKTNVPYLTHIDGKEYWFVNGKNTGVSMINFDGFIESGSGNLSQYFNEILKDYTWNIYPSDENGNLSYDSFMIRGTNDHIYVGINIYSTTIDEYNDFDVDYIDLLDGKYKLNWVDSKGILQNAEYVGVNGNNYIFKFNKNTDDIAYFIDLIYNEEIVDSNTIHVKACHPIYFGAADIYDISNFNDFNLLHKFASPSSYNRISFNVGESDGNLKTLIYAYPKSNDYQEVTNIVNNLTMDQMFSDFSRTTKYIDVNGELENYVIYYLKNIPDNIDVDLSFTNYKSDIAFKKNLI